MATSRSGSLPYCTADQLVNYFDERSVRQLLSDDGEPLAGSLSGSGRLTAVLMGASGDVESACCLGQRYAITADRNDLEDLAGNTAQRLVELVAVLAFWRLWSRRPDAGVRPPAAYGEAQDFLEKLRLGERVFGTDEALNSAHLAAEVESAATVEARGGVVVQAERYFGRRADRLGP